MTVAVGVDSGSTTTKVVVLVNGKVACTTSAVTGPDPAKTASLCIDKALSECGHTFREISCLVATGYGRERVSGATRILTEITCHARGAHAMVPAARTIIDIGGQDSKVIRLDERGFVQDFIMNDKCAAGTGRFLEVMAARLQVGLDEFGEEWGRARGSVKISSTCTVFAESEIISLISAGVKRPEVIKGLCNAIAGRVASMARRVGIEPAVVFTGGVSLNEGVRRALEDALSQKIVVPPMSQFMGAYGAALFAQDLVE
ncbi:MAG: 2-hydroxyglutaryl-CoA dehydratase [Candidatus Fermentithermobacillus carboniphilus]|uniref:2-hydroxyglutaryl-CoA dehydratase n=1 Tax=Candidatus Fermentithermobacillus carboniphilus TaxID=3085328 RepID=A0AAT9LCL6_9FIRM|nr:MAG: 2-hydroxyglutaryl-CoA dehydratase [Candidatus Fermentithermobacillus carboniphilus]